MDAMFLHNDFFPLNIFKCFENILSVFTPTHCNYYLILLHFNYIFTILNVQVALLH
jgi:hypothetical protein